MGGFEKVIVLGWNFSAGIAHDIASLGDAKLVLVVPPDLLDRLKKKGADKLAGDVRFSSLQYLQASVISRKETSDGERLQVALNNYVLLSPDAINLDEKNRGALQKVMNNEPLALIEYWAVDRTMTAKCSARSGKTTEAILRMTMTRCVSLLRPSLSYRSRLTCGRSAFGR